MSVSKKPSPPSDPFEGIKVWALVGTVGWQAAVPVIVLAMGGALLDKRLGTGPLLTVVGSILAIGVSFLLLKRTVQLTQQQTEAALRRSNITKPR
jgi:hypothetical protein